MNFLYLALAIAAEVIATSALKSAEGFTRLWPSLIVVIGYITAFGFLSLTLRTIPVGVAYAIWSGVGIIMISLLAWWIHNQNLAATTWLGIGLIVIGVVVVNLSSLQA